MVMPNELMQGGLPPPGLAEMIGGSMQQGGLPPGGPPPEQAPDELEAVQKVVQDLHTLMTVLKDPQMTNIAATTSITVTRETRPTLHRAEGAFRPEGVLVAALTWTSPLRRTGRS